MITNNNCGCQSGSTFTVTQFLSLILLPGAALGPIKVIISISLAGAVLSL